MDEKDTSDLSSDVEFLYSTKPLSQETSETEQNPINPAKLKSSQNQNISKAIETIFRKDEVIDQTKYGLLIQFLVRIGIGGSRLFFSEDSYEILKRVASFVYLQFPNKNAVSASYIRRFIPEFNEIVQTREFKQLKTNENLKKEISKIGPDFIIGRSFFHDKMYLIAIYISNEKLPDNFQFAPSMFTPTGWTAIYDYVLILSFQFFLDKEDIVADDKLPFKAMLYCMPGLFNWALKRLELINKEMEKIVPSNFLAYERKDKYKPKLFKSFENFQKINSHVIYPKRLSINFQKKIMRLLYLYGIPTNDGFNKIETILEINNNSLTSKSTLIFIHHILNRAKKHHYEIEAVIKLLPNIDQNDLISNEYFDNSWIKEDAIESISSNVSLLYHVRKYFPIFFDMNEKVKINFFRNLNLSECTYMKDEFRFWDLRCDIILFQITAFYGFLFNSMFLPYIHINKTDIRIIRKIRIREQLTLTPETNDPSLLFLGPIIIFENKKKRITEIINALRKI